MTGHPERDLRGSSAGAAAVVLDRGADVLLRQAVQGLRSCGVDGELTVLCHPARVGPVGELLGALVDRARVRAAATPAEALDVLATTAQAAGAAPLVVLDSGLVVSPVALLDLLDHPGRRTAAWVADGVAEQPVWPAVRRGLSKVSLVESVATGHHDVTAPTGAALGVLRLDGTDRSAAASAWRAAARLPSAGGPGETFAWALLAVVRAGLPVTAVDLTGWDVAAAAGTQDADAAIQRAGARPDDWRRRLLEAKRPVDGFYSIFVVRHVSRWVTWRLLPTGVAPNTVTLVSFGVGIATALACGVGGWAWLVLAAVLLQVSLVLDCVDGEIARYTRRFSPFGAWLDVTGDRVKEYGVFAALAVSSARAGHDVWGLAVLALTLVAYRHFVDYGHGVTIRARHRPRVSTAPLGERADGLVERPTVLRGGLGGAITATDATSGIALVHWVKKAIHLPIGERYLIISLTLLTGRAAVVLGTLVVLEVLSALYTTLGRVLRSVAGG